jgi:hypothetical protein
MKNIAAINEDEELERVIHNAQKGFGYIHPNDIWESESDNITPMFSEGAKSKLFGFGLVEETDTAIKRYRLTEKGWNFESFKKERAFYKRDRYVKNFAYWRAKYWVALIILGYLIGLLTPIISDILKSILLRLYKL